MNKKEKHIINNKKEKFFISIKNYNFKRNWFNQLTQSTVEYI